MNLPRLFRRRLAWTTTLFWSVTAAAAVVLAGAPAAAWAQTAPPTAAPAQAPAPPLRIFLDCYQCDTEFLRQNVLFVDYMRDRTDADLHVLVTTQGTGSGGTSWTLKFIGLGRFQGQDRTQTFTTSESATSDDERKEFARIFRLGLAGYAADTAVARELDVRWRPPATTAAPAAPRRDRWNFWVFRINGNANLNGESLSKSHSHRLSFSANRVTERWKINLSSNGSVSENTFTLSDGRTIKSRSDNWGVSGLTVKSVGPRFSLGGRVSASHSSFSNQDRGLSIYPGLEFNFFPYAQFERRSFTIWYEVGPNFYDYREVTIFDKLQETVVKQQVDVSLALRQPWGSLNAFTSVSQHLNHLDRYSASIRGSTDVRLFKGFSFNVYAEYSKIRDQIGLRKAGASTEEVLLRLQQLATGYRYYYGVGFSYSFGSIFNSVVNPRFGGSNFFF
jgi:hypothetical protein